MTENIDVFFTQKHERLVRIASAAKIFAWIALVIFGLAGTIQLLQLIYQLNPSQSGFLWGNNLLTFIISFLRDLSYFMNGVIYWLVLKGISLGLNMIVETDLNYRGIKEGETHE